MQDCQAFDWFGPKDVEFKECSLYKSGTLSGSLDDERIRYASICPKVGTRSCSLKQGIKYYTYRRLWGSVTKRKRIMSDSECMTLCEGTEACVAFSFSGQLKTCNLFGKPIGEALSSQQNDPYWKSGLCIGKVTKGLKNCFAGLNGPSYAIADNGGLIEKTTFDSAKECADKCTLMQDCQAFDWFGPKDAEFKDCSLYKSGTLSGSLDDERIRYAS